MVPNELSNTHAHGDYFTTMFAVSLLDIDLTRPGSVHLRPRAAVVVLLLKTDNTQNQYGLTAFSCAFTFVWLEPLYHCNSVSEELCTCASDLL